MSLLGQFRIVSIGANAVIPFTRANCNERFFFIDFHLRTQEQYKLYYTTQEHKKRTSSGDLEMLVRHFSVTWLNLQVTLPYIRLLKHLQLPATCVCGPHPPRRVQ